jgi:hypothetical protein
MDIRKIVTLMDETRMGMGGIAEPPLRKVIVAAVIPNPYAGSYSESLDDLIEPSEDLGTLLATHLVEALDHHVESYGKAGIVGIAGEQEHANACLTTRFANPLRSAVGGGKAWFPSVTKRGAAGVSVDVPLAYKDALYVRSHYDAITIAIPDAPAPDEIVVILGAANRGRLNARLGGLRKEDVVGQDGLR